MTTTVNDLDFVPDPEPLTPELIREAEEAITIARFRAASAQPYMRAGLMQLRLIPSTYLPTLGVDESWRCFFNPRFVIAQPVAELAFIMLHELWHGLRGHHARARALGLDVPRPDAPLVDILNALSDNKILNIAGDCEINDDLAMSIEAQSRLPQKIAKAKLALPEKAVLPSKFGMPDELFMEEYYHRLQKNRITITVNFKNDDLPQCGGIAGNSSEAERRAQADAAGRGELPPALTPIDIRLTQISIAEGIRQHIQTYGRGSVPAGQLRWAEEILGPERVAWQTVLASVCRRALTWVAGRSDYSFQKLSRRSSNEFTFPGLRSPQPNLLLIADTSGSVSGRALGVVVDETSHILRRHGQKNLRFLAVDAGCAAPVTVFHARDVRSHLLGGGGTDMRIGFAVAEQLKPRPDITILFSDGDTPWPDTQPRCGKVIIVLIDASTKAVAEASALDWAMVVPVTSDEA